MIVLALITAFLLGFLVGVVVFCMLLVVTDDIAFAMQTDPGGLTNNALPRSRIGQESRSRNAAPIDSKLVR